MRGAPAWQVCDSPRAIRICPSFTKFMPQRDILILKMGQEHQCYTLLWCHDSLAFCVWYFFSPSGAWVTVRGHRPNPWSGLALDVNGRSRLCYSLSQEASGQAPCKLSPKPVLRSSVKRAQRPPRTSHSLAHEHTCTRGLLLLGLQEL